METFKLDLHSISQWLAHQWTPNLEVLGLSLTLITRTDCFLPVPSLTKGMIKEATKPSKLFCNIPAE